MATPRRRLHDSVQRPDGPVGYQEAKVYSRLDDLGGDHHTCSLSPRRRRPPPAAPSDGRHTGG
ncbi:MAG: hypothetical protein RQ985_05445 [Dehalococcoidia bacterium]|nr:hypothetical protein [Dehalococcoidia bacterium]